MTADPYVPPVVDEDRDFELGPLDIVLGLLTFPLLLFALQYAFSGSEKLVATRAARLRLYACLLPAELLIAALVVWLVMR